MGKSQLKVDTGPPIISVDCVVDYISVWGAHN